MTKRNNLIIAFLILVVVQSCSLNNKKVERAFYYWKTSFELSISDINYMKSLDITKIYLRLFDVVWNENSNKAEPIAAVKLNKVGLREVKIVPTIFITNNTLLKISERKLSQLATNIVDKIESYFGHSTDLFFDEIQIDCDWSDNTRFKYFLLLQNIKAKIGDKNLSVTIRLHQIKYYKRTGVPPVDSGILMFYNMSSVSNIETKNSIYDENTAKKYLINFDNYPLELDIALPAFSWIALFRDDKIFALINNTNIEELRDTNKYQAISNSLFTPLAEHFFHGEYIIPNDIIKTEIISPEITLSAAKLISQYIRNNNVTVSIYHFHKELKNEYSQKDLDNIFTAFN